MRAWKDKCEYLAVTLHDNDFITELRLYCTMNNFEKWKKRHNENITMEQLAIKVSYRDCRLCPAFGSGYCEYPEFSCKDGILRWAKGEYDD